MTSEERAADWIRFAMRVRGNETPWPDKLQPSPDLLKLVDEPMAQKIYQEILAELKQHSARETALRTGDDIAQEKK